LDILSIRNIGGRIMAHYALLDSSNKVVQVIVGANETEVINGISDWEAHYAETYKQRCVRTSYNGNIRKQYAGIGYTYDEAKDQFVAPQPFPSWILNEDNDWMAPVPKPRGYFLWDESTLSWVATIVG
jgi:hypothetical protein